MKLLREHKAGLRCSPYGCTAALLDPPCVRSRRFLHGFLPVV
ncbi:MULTISPECIES: hypothetical protein [Roseateles]|nr:MULTISPECIES: hypothetical protein [unclassified Roseateles]HEV6965626.1 hypothetical protein [Roseateles sp.]